MNTKRTLIQTVVLWAALLVPAVVQAQFTFITNNGAITITGYTGNPTTLTIPSTTNGLNVVSIADSAFFNQTNLTSVTIIGGNLTNIGNLAFSGCGITNFISPSNLKSIGTYAFANCANLIGFTFLGSTIACTNIPDGTFSGCSKLSYQNNLSNLGYINGIENSAFAGCGFTNFSLTTIGNNLSGGFRSLGTNAFANCANLIGFTLNANITSIPSTTFYDDAMLSSITIPNSVTNIGYETFYGCTSLTSITFPYNVSSISDAAFQGCSSLTNFNFQGNAPTLGGPDVFSGVNPAAAVNYIDSTAGWSTVFGGLSNLVAQVVFTYTTTNGVVTITGYTGSAGVITIPSTITGQPVTSVGAQAFYNSPILTGVTIGTNITDISEEAFYGCASLTNLTIANSVTNIGAGAFLGCSGLRSVAIPNSVTSLGGSPFVDCYDLTNIAVAASNPAYSSVGGVLFDNAKAVLVEFPGGLGGNYTIPASVATIGPVAFGDCTRLTNVTIGTNVTDIEYQAFYGCAAFTNIAIPSSVTNLGDNAFQFCSDLTSVLIPDSVTSIGVAPFADCTILTNIAVAASNSAYSSIGGVLFDSAQSLFIEFPAGLGGNYNIPNSVTNIGARAFESCTNLTNVTIPNSVTSIGDFAFYGCSGLTSMTIPNGVASIPDSAFANCYALTNVTIPDSVTNIGDFAFEGCFHLTSVAIPNSVTSIGDYAFYVCFGLTSVTIPNSVTSIGDYAFSDCFYLNTLLFQGNAPLLGGTNVFSDDNTTAVVNYLPGTTNWGPTYGGLHTVMLTPQIADANSGVSTNGFGFTINGAVGMVVVVQASTDLVNWQPILTNTMTGTTFNFSDPQWTNYPGRYYRLRSP